MAKQFETGKGLESAVVLALSALSWTLEDEHRSTRLLALSGLEADDLRTRIMEPVILSEILLFLESHEPDLLACAAALDIPPEGLVNARKLLQGSAS